MRWWKDERMNARGQCLRPSINPRLHWSLRIGNACIIFKLFLHKTVHVMPKGCSRGVEGAIENWRTCSCTGPFQMPLSTHRFFAPLAFTYLGHSESRIVNGAQRNLNAKLN